MLTVDKRADMAACCMNHAREVAEKEAESLGCDVSEFGDFEAGESYLRDCAPDWELQAEYDRLPQSAK